MTYLSEKPYYRMSFTIVSLFAYMPNQPLYKCVFVTSFSAVVLSAAMFCELMVFYTKGFQMITFVGVVPPITAITSCFILMPVMYINRKRLEKIYQILESNLARNWNENEMAAKRKFEQLSHVVIKLMSFTIIMCAPSITFWAFIPQFLDIIMPINGTRKRILPFPAEFFVDEEKYFYQIVFVLYVFSTIVVFIVGSAESMFIAAIYFVCGMFAIIGYRLENILENHPGIEDQGKMMNEDKLIDKIRRCMKDYRTMKECVMLMNSYVVVIIPWLLITTVVSFSINLVQVTNIELINPRNVLFAFAQISQFFVMSFAAQTLLDSSATLPNTVYGARWYDCPIKVQKMFILIQLAIHKPTAISSRNMFVLGIENFGVVTRTAMSYFMVLRQFQ